MAQALDNLIANALEHGGPPVVVTGASVAGRVRVTVANGCATGRGPGMTGDGEGHDPPAAAMASRSSPSVASDHRGRFALCRTGSGCVAALELPLVDAGVAQAA